MESWTAEVVGRIHAANITKIELAEEAGISNSYLSAILHGKRGDSEDNKKRIFNALENLERKQAAGAEN